MHPDTTKYNAAQTPADRAICQRLAEAIDAKEGTFIAASAAILAVAGPAPALVLR